MLVPAWDFVVDAGWHGHIAVMRGVENGFSIARAVLAAALLRVGRAADAKAIARDVLECEPTFTIHGLAVSAELEPAVFGAFADAWREIGLPE